MANFLNTDGLSALWAKIKSKFYTKTEVDAAIPDASSTSPLMDGTATIGSSINYARADHVHPSDTSKANTSDVLSKTNTTSYTPTGDYNPATKKYVDDSIPSASTITPEMDGTAAVGTSTAYARANHVHPSDTSKLTRHVSQSGGLEHSTISNLYNQFMVTVANDGGGLVNNFTLTPTSTTINNVVMPTSDGMAANKKYVDDSISGISTDLVGLTDTTISSPTNGQVLSYDSTTSKWINTNALTETRVSELITAALAQYGDGDTASYGYTNASEVNY